MHKKVLIITYYWPPAGGPGVQRWLKFVKYLPNYGFHPVIYTPENPNYPMLDESLINELPSAVTVIKQPIREPYRLARLISKKSTKGLSSGIIPKAKRQNTIERLMLYIRGNWFVPDARKAWVKPSVRFLSKYLQDESIDAIITTGPPHSLHLIGLRLKTELGVKWIADFRDPWTTIGYHKQLKLTSRTIKKHEALEAKVLRGADQIVVTSANTKAAFALKTKQPIAVITNGYDYQRLPFVSKDNKFTIAHIGSLLAGRNPKLLWKVLGELVREDEQFKDLFCLRLAGVISSEVLDEIRRSIPETNLDCVGYISHKEALIMQRQSQLLLLIEIDSEETKAIVPGKLFEYMVANTPIIALGPPDSDVEKILFTSNSGRYFNYGAEAELKAHLKLCFANFQNGNLTSFPIGLKQYSRRFLTKRLAELLSSLP